MFDRATIRLGIGPHSSYQLLQWSSQSVRLVCVCVCVCVCVYLPVHSDNNFLTK